VKILQITEFLPVPTAIRDRKIGEAAYQTTPLPMEFQTESSTSTITLHGRNREYSW
jgi:hypothetical protein